MFGQSKREQNQASSSNNTMDPFTRAMQPPANETPEQSVERQRAMQEAREISRKIDEGIMDDKKALERKKRAVKVLLLGQAESGKSTLLKNFKLAFCPAQFKQESAAWKTVIQLNLIRSVKVLLHVLQTELDSAAAASLPTTPYSSRTSMRLVSSPTGRLTDEHRRIRMRLSPLLAIEESLSRRLHSTFPDHSYWIPSPSSSKASGSLPSPLSRNHSYGAGQSQTAQNPQGLPFTNLRRGSSNELCVRAGSDWHNILAAATTKDDRRGGRTKRENGSDDPTAALAACRDDIAALWADPTVKVLLDEQGIQMEYESGFFLNDVNRIARMDFQPATGDILRARLKTIGIEEHHLLVEGHQDWYIYDVNGSRSSRSRWIPYFDDASAIVFLVPLVFNSFLEEDSSVNRLEDSFMLWTDICRNKLLQHATLVLMLNKMDVLAKVLEGGETVRRFIPSYQGANELESVVKYFKLKFLAIHKKAHNKSRDLFVHEATCIEATTTETILLSVRHAILTDHLRKIDLII